MSARQQAESFPGRNFYTSKGVGWGRFLPWLTAAFAVAAVLAECMAQLFRVGQYYIFIVPFVAALCVAGMINLAVNKGHCRSAIAGGLAGFCAGFVLYIGFFYCGMIHDIGPGIAGHPEFLPTYIRLRMKVEVTRDVGDSRHENERKLPSQGDVYMNWGRFVFELAVVLGITTVAGLKRAQKPYCETCRRWMIRELTPFDPAHSAELLEALRIQSARSLAALCAKAPFTTIPNVSLAVDFCPTLKDGMSRDCPIYVSVKNINTAPKNAVRDTFEQSKGKMLVRGMQLNPDELAALGTRFKMFETLAGRSAVAALLPQENADFAGDKDVTYAEITSLGQDHSGKIMTRKTVLIGNAFSLGILVGFFAGIGLLLWGLLTAFPDHPPADGVTPHAMTLGIALMILGGTCFCVSLAVALIDSSFFGNRYVRKQLHQEFARRSSLMVEPNDPDAFFVELVPKLNWGKMMLDNASDVGLLVVDRQKREIRFEGDKERWRIPASAITRCQFEAYIQQQGHAKTRIFYAVLQANHRNGFWEAPIRPRGGMGLFSKKRKNATRKLFETIEGIRGVDKTGTPVRA